ncbi:sulfatase, partial [Halalkalibaculum sp. DA384]|uniref:sulfatase family protein n=1 Tax=Halalkalibaculum sp. DA384 TaxID=3373606 RepID=UPI00375442D8
AQAAGADRPNILWISVEDISPLMGVYGDPVVETPVIDQLAAEGMMYTNAFTTAGVCSPSRTAIITGLHQSSIGAHHHRPTHTGHAHKTIPDGEPLVSGAVTPYLVVPPPYVKAFPEYLRAAGYYTTNNVKTDYNFGLPASVWDESSREAHWRNRPEGKPFFSVINLTTTHESQVWQSELPLSVDPDAVPVPPYLPDTPVVRRDIAQQYTNIEQMDRQVGQILADLEEDGLADDTIVFFWSDHGGALPRQKSWLYDSGIHVPLIIRWPGEIPPGQVNKELVSFVDLAPTVLSLAG